MTDQSVKQIIFRCFRLFLLLFVVLQFTTMSINAAQPEGEPGVSGQEDGTTVPAGARHTIYLKSRTFLPDTASTDSLAVLARPDQERIHILVQLDFMPRALAKEALRTRGLRLLAYVPDYAWIASVPAANPADVLDLPGVTWAGELTVADKLDPAIKSGSWS